MKRIKHFTTANKFGILRNEGPVETDLVYVIYIPSSLHKESRSRFLKLNLGCYRQLGTQTSKVREQDHEMIRQDIDPLRLDCTIYGLPEATKYFRDDSFFLILF